MTRLISRRTAAVAVTCIAVGAAGGIVGSAAAPGGKAGPRAATTGTNATPPPGPGGRGPMGFGMHEAFGAVHAEAVVPKQDGSGFETISTDQGTLKAIDGSKLTIREGTDKVEYKTLDITVPDGAKVFRNGKAAQLSDLKTGDDVRVVDAPERFLVIAHDDSFKPQGRFDRMRHGRRAFPGPPPGMMPGSP
jgi:hypothetical protein